MKKSLIQKAEDVEVLFEFFIKKQIDESEINQELKNFSSLIKDFELKLLLNGKNDIDNACLLYTSPSPRDNR